MKTDPPECLSGLEKLAWEEGWRAGAMDEALTREEGLSREQREVTAYVQSMLRAGGRWARPEEVAFSLVYVYGERLSWRRRIKLIRDVLRPWRPR